MGRYILDDVTGEMIPLEEGTRIIPPKSLKYLKELENKIEIPKDVEFIKMMRESLPELASCGLSIPESRVFFYLLENVRYGSNVAKYDTGKLITRENISEDMEMPISNVHRTVIKLCQKGLIAIAKIDVGKVFIVNPFVAMRGHNIDKTTYDLFKKTRWAKSWIGKKKS